MLVDGWVERTPVRVRVRCSRRARGRECGERRACRVNPATVVNPFPLGSLWLWLTGADLRDFFEFDGLFLSQLSRTTCSSLIGRGARKVGRNSVGLLFWIVCFSIRQVPTTTQGARKAARWERTWARPRATARASSPSSTTASDGTARRSSRARVGCVRAPSRPAPLRFSVFRYSPEIGQPERPRRARLSTYPPSPRPTNPHAAVHTEHRGGQRRRRLERRRAAHLLHLDRARGPVVLRRSPWRRLDLLRRDAHRARRSRPSRRERRARGVRARGVGGAAPRGGTIRAHRRRALGAGRTPPTRRRRRPVRRLRLRLRLRRGSRLRPSETAPRPAPRDRASRPAAAAPDERRGRHELPLRRVALRRGGSTGERRSIDDGGAIRYSRG